MIYGRNASIVLKYFALIPLQRLFQRLLLFVVRYNHWQALKLFYFAAMQQAVHRYFLLHKPYGMESQFKENYPSALLGDLSFSFPEGTHALGRLDKPSEGLLLLTTNKKMTGLLFQGPVPHPRTYLVEVRHVVSDETIQKLRTGVSIRLSGDTYYTTPPCQVCRAEAPPFPPPFPSSPYLKTSWLQITLTEGKFRQVRKMMEAVRHRCLRLIRISIEDIHLEGLQPGEVKEVNEEFFFQKLKLTPDKHK